MPLPLPSELSENDDTKNGEPDALESAKQPQLFVMGHLQELNVSISTPVCYSLFFGDHTSFFSLV